MSLSRLPAKGLRDGGGGCSILGTVRQLRPRMTMTSRYSADIAARLAPLSLILGWSRRGAGGPRYTKGRGRGGVQLRHVSATYILVRLILPGGIIARGRRERFHYTASRGIIFSDISSLAAPAGLKFRPSASPSAPLLPRGDPPQPLLQTMEEKLWTRLDRGKMAAAWVISSFSIFDPFGFGFLTFKSKNFKSVEFSPSMIFSLGRSGCERVSFDLARSISLEFGQILGIGRETFLFKSCMNKFVNEWNCKVSPEFRMEQSFFLKLLRVVMACIYDSLRTTTSVIRML